MLFGGVGFIVPLDGVEAKLSQPNEPPAMHNAAAKTTRILKMPGCELRCFFMGFKGLPTFASHSRFGLSGRS